MSLPTPTDRGRTYAFQLRHGHRYSTGAPVRASDIRRELERVLRERASRPTGSTAGSAEPRRAQRGTRHCDLSPGVRVDDAAGTITFRLTAADPDFLYKLAQTLAVAGPSGHQRVRRSASRCRPPARTWSPSSIASTLRLVRNPRFRPTDGRPDGYPDEITFACDVDRREAIRAVEQRTCGPRGHRGPQRRAAPAQLDAIVTRYAGQLHTTSQPLTNFMFLNTRVPPFDDLDARRALNYAVDRRAVVAVDGGRPLRAGHLPDPAAELPRLPALLPVHHRRRRQAGRGAAPDLAQARRLSPARTHGAWR